MIIFITREEFMPWEPIECFLDLRNAKRLCFKNTAGELTFLNVSSRFTSSPTKVAACAVLFPDDTKYYPVTKKFYKGDKGFYEYLLVKTLPTKSEILIVKH